MLLLLINTRKLYVVKINIGIETKEGNLSRKSKNKKVEHIRKRI